MSKLTRVLTAITESIIGFAKKGDVDKIIEICEAVQEINKKYPEDK